MDQRSEIFPHPKAYDQVQRDKVPLSDFEKRTMYLTKSDDAVENPTEVNLEFEAQHNGPEYEPKIARLPCRAYKRLKKEISETA